MTAKFFVLAAVLACTGLMPVPAAANLVQNHLSSPGDPTGWSIVNLSLSGNYGGHVTQALNPPDGTIHVFVSPPDGFGVQIFTDIGWGGISQTLATVPGQTYRVHYLVSVSADSRNSGFVAIFDDIGYMGAHPLIGFGPFASDPLPPGSPISSCFGCSGTAFYARGGYDETFFATATGNSTTIEFASTDPCCEFSIGGVSVDPVQEPPTFFLFAVGLFAMWVGVRRGGSATPVP